VMRRDERDARDASERASERARGKRREGNGERREWRESRDHSTGTGPFMSVPDANLPESERTPRSFASPVPSPWQKGRGRATYPSSLLHLHTSTPHLHTPAPPFLLYRTAPSLAVPLVLICALYSVSMMHE
jgi:hypothetical protein